MVAAPPRLLGAAQRETESLPRATISQRSRPLIALCSRLPARRRPPQLPTPPASLLSARRQTSDGSSGSRNSVLTPSRISVLTPSRNAGAPAMEKTPSKKHLSTNEEVVRPAEGQGVSLTAGI